MWSSKFEYVRPYNVSEALAILDQSEDAKLIAGGHSLLPALKLRLSSPSVLVDIGRLSELKGIHANGSLRIGAGTTHAQVAASDQVKAYCPPLASAASIIGDPAVRNFGTIGGNIAHADPASDPPTILLAAGATIHLQGLNGTRAVSADDFFIDLFTTALEPGEVVTAVEVPNLSGKKSAYAKMAHPASRYALAGVCVILDMDGDTVQNAVVTVGGATVKATRAPSAEAALAGKSLSDATVEDAAGALKRDIAEWLTGDMVYPEAYRQEMAAAYFKRAIRSIS